MQSCNSPLNQDNYAAVVQITLSRGLVEFEERDEEPCIPG